VYVATVTEARESKGPNFAIWVIVGIVVLMIGGIAATIAISVSHGVSDGYIPPEERSAE
jgi:hypothetical protein